MGGSITIPVYGKSAMLSIVCAFLMGPGTDSMGGPAPLAPVLLGPGQHASTVPAAGRLRARSAARCVLLQRLRGGLVRGTPGGARDASERDGMDRRSDAGAASESEDSQPLAPPTSDPMVLDTPFRGLTANSFGRAQESGQPGEGVEYLESGARGPVLDQTPFSAARRPEVRPAEASGERGWVREMIGAGSGLGRVAVPFTPVTPVILDEGEDETTSSDELADAGRRGGHLGREEQEPVAAEPEQCRPEGHGGNARRFGGEFSRGDTGSIEASGHALGGSRDDAESISEREFAHADGDAQNPNGAERSHDADRSSEDMEPGAFLSVGRLKLPLGVSDRASGSRAAQACVCLLSVLCVRTTRCRKEMLFVFWTHCRPFLTASLSVMRAREFMKSTHIILCSGSQTFQCVNHRC